MCLEYSIYPLIWFSDSIIKGYLVTYCVHGHFIRINDVFNWRIALFPQCMLSVSRTFRLLEIILVITVNCSMIYSVMVSLISQLVKNPPATQETPVWFLGQEDPLEKGKAPHSSILAWRIPWAVIVPGVAKSQTQLSNFHFHFHIPLSTDLLIPTAHYTARLAGFWLKGKSNDGYVVSHLIR